MKSINCDTLKWLPNHIYSYHVSKFIIASVKLTLLISWQLFLWSFEKNMMRSSWKLTAKNIKLYLNKFFTNVLIVAFLAVALYNALKMYIQMEFQGVTQMAWYYIPLHLQWTKINYVESLLLSINIFL